MRHHDKRSTTGLVLSILAALVILSLAGMGSLRAGPDGQGPPTQVDQLRAFAKVYGYARFFHPSDEAAAADWEQLAVDGSARILGMTKKDRLDRVLLEIFRPVAPTIQIVRSDDEPELPAPAPLSSGDDVLAWQHQGVGVLNDGRYMSVRRGGHNFIGASNINETAYLMQTIAADGLGGKEIRLSFAARMETERSVGFPMGWGSGILFAYLEDGVVDFYKDMEDRKILSPEWQRYEIVATLDEEAATITLGVAFRYAGSLWLDAFECEVRDPGGDWVPVALANPGFEDVLRPLTGWDQLSDAFRFAADANQPFEGEFSALIANEPTPTSDRLLDPIPALGEVIDKEIGCDLKVILPLTLPADGADADAPPAPPAGEDLEAGDTATRVAAVVIAWNLFQHFYPYFDVLDTDWNEQLTQALTGALEAQSDPEFLRVLEKLHAALQDGHINVTGPDRDYKQAALPIRVGWIEDQVVVTASATPEVLRGDVILELDGRPAREVLEEAEQYISGSPQRRRFVACWMFVYGENYSEALLTVLRDGERTQVSLQRTTVYVPYIPRPAKISEIADGIYYVDLSRASLSEIEAVMGELAVASGVIFDLRGYPLNSAEQVISHMIDEEVLSASWNIPLAIYPDRENVVWQARPRWIISPREPRIQGAIVFLTDVRAISYAESVMGIIEAYDLAEIVGRPTAGANGNVNLLHMPGGYQTGWTGMQVLKHDGSQHHMIGILPTVPVAPTIAGVREGRDEDLETAIAIIQGEPAP